MAKDRPTLSGKELKKIILSLTARQKLAYESMQYFFSIYLNHYITRDLAPFHYDFFKLAEDERKRLVAILAFRGSGKSTYFSTCYPIWAVTGKLQKKFVLIFTQTQQQARVLLGNIKRELEDNALLRSDIGPFEDPNDEWSAMSIVLKRYNARIMVASTDQSVRGLRYMQYRPDLIILDDVEDLASTKTQELRDKLFDWYSGEVKTIGIADPKIVIIGTRLHEDDLYTRIIKGIKGKHLKSAYRMYPIATASGHPSWPGKYPNKKAIETERARVGDEVTWQREYMLRIIYDESYIYKPDDFIRYEVLPPVQNIRFTPIGVDLAIGKSDTACFTAMVGAYIVGYKKDLKAYVIPMMVNRRLDFNETIQAAKELRDQLPSHVDPVLIVENVAYQQAAIEQLELEGFTVEPVTPQEDKRARLSAIAPLVKNGTILFPLHGTEDLERQLVGFGIEKYKDLADAFAYLAKRVQETMRQLEPNIRWL